MHPFYVHILILIPRVGMAY